MKPWIIVLIVLAVIAVILGLLYYFGKKAQTKQAAQQEQMEAMKQTVSMLIIDKKKLRMKDSGLPQPAQKDTGKQIFVPFSGVLLLFYLRFIDRIIRGFRKEFPLWKPLPPRPGSLSYSSHISVCDADSLPTARLRLFSTQ